MLSSPIPSDKWGGWTTDGFMKSGAEAGTGRAAVTPDWSVGSLDTFLDFCLCAVLRNATRDLIMARAPISLLQLRGDWRWRSRRDFVISIRYLAMQGGGTPNHDAGRMSMVETHFEVFWSFKIHDLGWAFVKASLRTRRLTASRTKSASRWRPTPLHPGWGTPGFCLGLSPVATAASPHPIPLNPV